LLLAVSTPREAEQKFFGFFFKKELLSFLLFRHGQAGATPPNPVQERLYRKVQWEQSRKR
jgi:hypothetical protein